MRSPARLFAAALVAAMTAIAMVALVADLVRGPGHHGDRQPAAERVGAQFVGLSAPGATGGGSSGGTASDVIGAGAASASAGPAGSASTPGRSGSPTGSATVVVDQPAARSAAQPDTAAKARATGSAKKIRPTHRQLMAAAVRKGKLPGEVTRSHYLRHLTGGPVDVPRMQNLGRWDAQHNTGRQQHVVLLDIGGQLGNGVVLSTTQRYVTYSGLSRAVTAYVRGYHSAQRNGAPVTVAIGTNNDLQTSAWTGRQWARQVVRPVQQAAKHYRGVVVAGATDIEPGFRVGPRGSRAWVRGFLSATKAPLIFNGSADGCSPVSPRSRCAHGWTASDLAWVAGTAAPHRISALPQVYNYTMADQWAMISLTAMRDGHRALRFHGPLTENAACRGEKSCPTMGSLAAWQALRNSLSLLGPVSLPARTDLDVH